MKWFRLYSEVLHDPKVQRLSPALFKHWVNLLCLASESEPPGLLPSVEDCAFALRVKPSDMATILAQLVRAGLVDRTPEGRHSPHNWPRRQRQSDDVAARVALHRERKAAEIAASQPASNGDVTLHETLRKRPVDSDTDTDTDTETEQRDLVPPVSATSAPALSLVASGAEDAPSASGKESGPVQKPQLKPRTLYGGESDAMQLAVAFAEGLRRNKPDVKLPRDLQGWAREFDLMLRVDHRPREKIEAVMAYALASTFWRRVVLSASKLREKFDTLDLQRMEDATDGKHGRSLGSARRGDGKPAVGTPEYYEAARRRQEEYARANANAWA